MPDFTITLSQKAVDKLQKLVDLTNTAEGTDYDVATWLAINAREIAIADQLTIANQTITQQEDAQRAIRINTALRAARDELIAALEDAPLTGPISQE